ncbi:MAG: hypothetical protein IJL93_04220 [Bacteroidales bacterium]|nr:hypothetical protein [Bacteroidales bacterium]
MAHDIRIRALTDTDVAGNLLLPDYLFSGFLYALLLVATLFLSVLSVIFFR